MGYEREREREKTKKLIQAQAFAVESIAPDFAVHDLPRESIWVGPWKHASIPGAIHWPCLWMPWLFDVCYFVETSRFDFKPGCADGLFLHQRSLDHFGWAVAPADAPSKSWSICDFDDGVSWDVVVQDLVARDCQLSLGIGCSTQSPTIARRQAVSVIIASVVF